MLRQSLQTALSNLARNKVYLVTRLVALMGGLMAGSTIYMMRYALDYGGWLPDAQGIFPSTGSHVPQSWFIAAVVLHVDVALWHCLVISGLLFAAGAITLTGRAARRRRDEHLPAIHYL
jgi:hypothetical protein